MSKQLLRGGTFVGAMVREAEHAESKPDFIHKMALHKKRSKKHFTGLNYSSKQTISTKKNTILINDATELLKLLTSIIKSTKANIHH